MNSSMTPLRPYLLWFVAWYLACVIGFSLFGYFTEVEFPGSLRLIFVTSLGMGVATKFIGSEWRAPTKKEGRLLSVYCTLASIVIGLVCALLALYFLGVLADFTGLMLSMLAAMPYWLWIYYLFMDVLLPYIILAYMFGRFSQKTVKQWVAKGRLPPSSAGA